MLTRLFSAHQGDDYEKTLKNRSVLLASVVALGLATVAASVFLGAVLPDHARGFYAGVGSGLALACAVGLLGTRRLMKDQAKMRAEFIKETDERGRAVTLKATSLTALVLIVAAYVAIMVAVALNRTVFYTLLATIALFCVTFLFAHAYFDKKL